MLRSRFDTIAATLDEEIDPAIRIAAERIVAEAKRRVPQDTGALHDAIHIDREGDGVYVVVAGDDDAWYGHIVEGGSAVGGKGRPPIPPHPFLIPAFESVRNNIDELVRDAFKDL